MPRFSRSTEDGLAAGFAAKTTTLRPEPSPKEIFKKLGISTSKPPHVESIFFDFSDKTALLCCLTAASLQTLGSTEKIFRFFLLLFLLSARRTPDLGCSSYFLTRPSICTCA
jgi:hypothetical protein